jgi:hypothetical protein
MKSAEGLRTSEKSFAPYLQTAKKFDEETAKKRAQQATSAYAMSHAEPQQ